MGKPEVIFLQERRAAALLDMTLKEFRQLVACGSLPQAGPFGRWDKEQLMDIMRGDSVKKAIQFEL